MTSGTVSVLLFCLAARSLAQATTADSQFNQVLNINGDMDLNSFTFPDRSRIEVFSQKQQQLIVNQNTPTVAANQVTGSTGQGFVALMQQSMSINTNGATDLVGGQIELQIAPQTLNQNAVSPANTFVGMLSPDRQSWMIMETFRSINQTDTSVRMVKRNSIDGEYMALGRQTIETNAVLMPFGDDQANAAVIQGTGIQEAEFQDGFRMSVRATQPVSMTVNVKDGVDQSMLAALQGQQPVNDFRYSVVSNLAGVTPDLNRMATVVQLPINAQRIQKMMQDAGVQQDGQVSLAVAQRGVKQNPGGATGNLNAAGAAPPARLRREEFRRSVAERQLQGVTAAGGATGGQAATGQTGQNGAQVGGGQAATNAPPTGTTNNNPVASQLLLEPTFTPIQANAVIDPLNMRIAVPVPQVDGEYIITMQTGRNAAEAQPAAPQPSGAEAQPAAPQPSGAEARPSNGTAEAGQQAGEAPKPAERRQESEGKPPAGAIFITMKEVNKMVELLQWGGQAPIGQMISEYVAANNGTK